MINEFKPIVSPYFGENGLTSTSANTIANRLKHLYEATESDLQSVDFVEQKFGLIGTSEKNFSLLKEGRKSCTVEEYISKLELIAECKAFIAFLREAIKAKNKLSEEVDDYMSEALAHLERPKIEQEIQEQDVIDSMTIKDRQRYLFLEARAATIGKFIHPGLSFDKAIKGIEAAIAEPRKVNMNGKDTILITKYPVVSLENANVVYMNLQNEHRKSEAELNGIKHMIEETIKEDAKKKAEKFTNAVQAYESERQRLTAKDAKVREARRKEIQALKIIIPKQYEALYNQVK